MLGLVFALMLSVSACGTTASQLLPLPQTSPEDAAVVQSGKHAAPAVRSLELYRHFADLVAGERFIKFVIDVKKNQMIYFNVREYPMHTDFIFKEIYKEEISRDWVSS